jgi:Spy/CpxP family protein refolding chaperone
MTGQTMPRPFPTAAALVAVALLISIPAAAGPGPGHPPPGAIERHNAFLDELGLTDEQKADVREVMRKHMSGALGEQLRAMRTAHEALATLIHDTDATDQQVTDSANAAAALAVRVAVERHHMVREMAALLTPEQRERAKELHKTHRAHRHDGPGDMEGF